jgi:peptidoglycan/xylan/chitin deacetylase (PgdA/CDA1 family)
MITSRHWNGVVQKGRLVTLRLAALVVAFVIVSGSPLVAAQPPAPDAAKENARDSDDPRGVLLKPIPEKLVVLTFDDGCASGATVVAPILKSLGFSATFYV